MKTITGGAAVEELQRILSLMQSNMGAIASSIHSLTLSGEWRHWIDREGREVEWGPGDFARFLEAAPPEGCGTPVALVRDLLQSSTADRLHARRLGLFEATLRGEGESAAVERTDAGLLYSAYTLVANFRSALDRVRCHAEAVPAALAAVIDGDHWRAIDTGSGVVRWGERDFARFIEAPWPKGCRTSPAVVRQALRGSPMLERFNALAGD